MKKYIVLFLLGFIVVNIAQARNRGDFCGTAKALDDYRAGKIPLRPTLSGPELTIDRTFFRIHYTHSGNDAVSDVYAESTASYVSYCWAKEIDTLGWAAPPPDYGQGGDDRYDFYIRLLSSGVMGTTYSENSYTNPYPNGVSSYIALSNVYSGNDLKVTIAHEFCHASEFRYSSVEGTWWMENCATWMEDLVYDDVNYYTGYLSSPPNPLSNPNLGINNGSGLYWYAGAIWAMFLSDRFGVDCVRNMWVYQGQTAGQNALQGIDYVLSSQCSSSLVSALKQYAVWRYFTGSRADTIHYFKEGNLFPTVYPTATHTSYPVSGNQLSYSLANPGGAGYIQLMNGGGKIFISFNAQTIYRFGCFVIGYRPNNQSTVNELALNSSAAGSDSFDWLPYDNFALIPVAVQWEYNTGSLGYSYTASIRILHDIGIVSLSGYTNNVDSGVVITPQALVKNYGQNPETFPVRFTIGDAYTNTQSVTLNSGDSSVANFLPCSLRTRGYNAVQCTTLLNGDERVTNNSLTDRIFVRVKDVALLAILEPEQSVNQGEQIHPEVTIKNYGNVREIFYVDCRIGNWTGTQRISLAAGLQFDLEFDSTWSATDTGHYAVKCSTKLTNDVNNNNDWMVSNCYVHPSAINEDISVRPIQKPTISFYNNRIVINNVSQAGSLTLELFDMQGRMVFSEISNQHEFNLNNNLPAGCYIVRLKIDDQILRYKSVIIR
jgi:hypothetical protein